MNMNLPDNILDIDEMRFKLRPEYFDNQSFLHGINHTYRVMYHCLVLGELVHLRKAGQLSFMGAFIHDMARKNDGYCTQHGLWSATVKLPLFRSLFLASGASEEDIRLVETAVHYHSLPLDIAASDPAWQVSALLKDADALDRIRLGEANLRPEYLRFRETLSLIGPAKELYKRCPFEPLASFGELLALVG